MVPYPVVDGPVAKHLYPSSYPTYPLSNHSSAEGAARSVSAPSSANPAGPQIHIPIRSRAAACRPPQGRTGRRITTLPLYRRRQRGEAMSIYKDPRLTDNNPRISRSFRKQLSRASLGRQHMSRRSPLRHQRIGNLGCLIGDFIL